jgi:hypothetical protein
MRAQHDYRNLCMRVLSVLRALFVRVAVPGIALLAIVMILFVMSFAGHVHTTHISTSVSQLIAGSGPGNGGLGTGNTTP